MKNRLLGLILLISLVVVYILQPYYGNISDGVYNIAKYAIAICGAWVGLKLLIHPIK